jgi:hypothetical protein
MMVDAFVIRCISIVDVCSECRLIFTRDLFIPLYYLVAR